MRAELFEAREVVARGEDVDVGECGVHPARQRLVGGIALEGVQPDDAMSQPGESGHLLGEELRFAHLEPVRAENDHSAAHETPVAVLVEQLLEALADPRAAVPVDHLLGRAGEGLVGA